ncbi:MAG: DinB family protein, partial [Tepidisphaeraceae bacterium]
PIGAFPSPDSSLSVARLSDQFCEIATRRNKFFDTLTDADLSRTVTAKPAPDRTISFPLGVTMLQIPSHTSHHRAQVVNMLRQIGADPPKVDFILLTRE